MMSGGDDDYSVYSCYAATLLSCLCLRGIVRGSCVRCVPSLRYPLLNAFRRRYGRTDMQERKKPLGNIATFEAFFPLNAFRKALADVEAGRDGFLRIAE